MTTDDTFDISRATAAAMRLFDAKRRDEAIAAFRRILAVDPTNLAALYQIANAYLGLADIPRAAQECDRALALLPDQPDLLVLRGVIASNEHDHVGALARFERARELNPELTNIDASIAEQLCFLGRGPEAIAAFDRAIARSRHDPKLQSQRLYFLNYFRLQDRQTLFEEHRAWGAWIEAHYRPQWRPYDNPKDPERPLKIGLVSGDLRNHSVAFFIEGYLREHDRSRYPIDCFDVSPYAEDAVTARLRTLADRWHRVGDLDEDVLAEYIREQQIDVLVDLSGHTGHNRLLTFAQRPAPVQVSWFGYMNTTGLTAIDYRITDPHLDPPGQSERFYTESLFRIPAMACFSPAADAPEVGPLPALGSGRITFGCVNQWTKASDDVKAVWASILTALPSSRLLIVARGSVDAHARARIVAEFTGRGASASQIVVFPTVPLAEFLRLFAQIDVALDPFPYGGGTTTLHTVWMGVPIVTLEGHTEMSRSTSGILRALGHPEWIAGDAAGYRAVALALASDLPGLGTVRAGLREEMSDSTLLGSRALTRELETAFRCMWHNYCLARQGDSAAPVQPLRFPEIDP